MIIITGMSASGKTTCAKELEKNYGFIKAITTTTREKRDNEIDGVDYFFISKLEFENRIKKGLFVEYTYYNNNYYGCGIDQINDNKVIVLDPNGLKAFQKLNDPNLVTFLLVCDEKEREKRMIIRGDRKEKILERLNNDRHDFSTKKIEDIDFIIATNTQEKEKTAEIVYNKYTEKINK